MSSIIDDTNLPALIPGILAKRPEDRSQIEQAALDAYNVKLGPAGAAKVGEVAGLEAKLFQHWRRWPQLANHVVLAIHSILRFEAAFQSGQAPCLPSH